MMTTSVYCEAVSCVPVEAGGLNPVPNIGLHELAETFFRYNQIADKATDYAIKQAFRLIDECHPNLDTATMDALKLLTFQQFLIKKAYCRTQCNRFIKLIRNVLNWGGLYKLVSRQLIYELSLVPPVKYGTAKENAPREIAPHNYVDAIIPHLPPMIADMLRLQIATGMRPSEVCRMTAADISKDNSLFADNWLYAPDTHKTKRHGKKRYILLGLPEQDIIAAYIDSPGPLFRNKQGKQISPAEYGRKIKQTIEKHGTGKFTPYQIRHTAATEVSREFGRDFARAFLGHSSDAITSVYDHSDFEKLKTIVSSRNHAVNPVLRVFTGE